MNGEVMSLPERPKEKLARFARKLGTGVVSIAWLLGFDAAATELTDPKELPSVHTVDKRIIDSFIPQATARELPDDPELEKQYLDSDFVMIFFSGMGMEISEINAAIYEETLLEMGGRPAYFWYGHEYNSQKSAQAVVDFLTRVTPAGETRKVVLYGTSFGGMAAQDIISEPVFQQAQNIELLGIFVEGSPANSASVKGDIAGLPLSGLIENTPVVPPLGRGAVWSIYAAQQIARGQVFDLRQGYYTLHTTLKTRPALARSQLDRIKRGINAIPLSAQTAELGKSTKLIFIAPTFDPDIDTMQAYEEYNKREDIQGSYEEVADDIHAGSWHINRADIYKEAIKRGIAQLRE